MPGFAELAARSHYSFLEGSASPKRMVQTAARLGIAALGLCDRNGLYGAVELIQAANDHGGEDNITAVLFAGGFVFWTYYPHDNLPSPLNTMPISAK